MFLLLFFRRRSMRAEEGPSTQHIISSAGPPLLPLKIPTKTAECLLCSEVIDLIYFEPCGHQLVCEECCIRMKKCLNCHQQILRKITNHGVILNANSRPTTTTTTTTMNPSAERLRYLENKFAEIEETYCCSICMERRRNIAFLCGHGACERCADALSTCHMCRTPITQKINLY